MLQMRTKQHSERILPTVTTRNNPGNCYLNPHCVVTASLLTSAVQACPMMDGSEISPLPRPPETESRCRDIKEMLVSKLVRTVNESAQAVVGLYLEFTEWKEED